jgi:hypothetical protein
MQDKSFQQAMEEWQSKLNSSFEDTLYQMIRQRTTVTQATTAIRDEKMRAIITRILIVGQMITLLILIKEMQIINEAQYNEFTAYLRHSLALELHDLPIDMLKFALEPRGETFRQSA